MNVKDAAYRTVHDYAGGANALHSRIGISSAHVLNSKVNPNVDSHHLTLDEADRIIGLTGDYRILQALAGAHGFALVPIRDDSNGVGDVLDAVLSEDEAVGELAKAVKDAIADGKITKRELSEVAACGLNVQGKVFRLLQALTRVSTSR